jgi:hypothetical protein
LLEIRALTALVSKAAEILESVAPRCLIDLRQVFVTASLPKTLFGEVTSLGLLGMKSLKEQCFKTLF